MMWITSTIPPDGVADVTAHGTAAKRAPVGCAASEQRGSWPLNVARTVCMTPGIEEFPLCLGDKKYNFNTPILLICHLFFDQRFDGGTPSNLKSK